jgi:hypothetical protein
MQLLYRILPNQEHRAEQARARYCTVEITFDPSFHTRRYVLREFSDELSSKEKKFEVVGRDGQETPIVFR